MKQVLDNDPVAPFPGNLPAFCPVHQLFDLGYRLEADLVELRIISLKKNKNKRKKKKQ
jgi:hypothetical protein